MRYMLQLSICIAVIKADSDIVRSDIVRRRRREVLDVGSLKSASTTVATLWEVDGIEPPKRRSLPSQGDEGLGKGKKGNKEDNESGKGKDAKGMKDGEGKGSKGKKDDKESGKGSKGMKGDKEPGKGKESKGMKDDKESGKGKGSKGIKKDEGMSFYYF